VFLNSTRSVSGPKPGVGFSHARPRIPVVDAAKSWIVSPYLEVVTATHHCFSRTSPKLQNLNSRIFRLKRNRHQPYF